MKIEAIHHVSLLVADTELALGFYRDLLGLAVVERPPLGFPGAWLAIGERQLHLLQLPNPDSESMRPAHVGRDRHLALTVSGLDELAQRLAEAGVAVSRSKSGRNALFCRDPDGNGVELIAAE
ncbi:MAG TPA: VOC family protein [Gammaproteobacteria bacterium]